MSATLLLAIGLILVALAIFAAPRQDGKWRAWMHVGAAILAGVVIVIIVFGGLTR